MGRRRLHARLRHDGVRQLRDGGIRRRDHRHAALVVVVRLVDGKQTEMMIDIKKAEVFTRLRTVFDVDFRVQLMAGLIVDQLVDAKDDDPPDAPPAVKQVQRVYCHSLCHLISISPPSVEAISCRPGQYPGRHSVPLTLMRASACAPSIVRLSVAVSMTTT